MNYKIIIEPKAKDDLYKILLYIEEESSLYTAKNFISQLKKQIKSLSFMPQRCRNSFYFNDGKTKDLIYKGYIISYHIFNDCVYIVAVFRQRNY
jgi:plasmid stabilization system protein ParE